MALLLCLPVIAIRINFIGDAENKERLGYFKTVRY